MWFKLLYFFFDDFRCVLLVVLVEIVKCFYDFYVVDFFCNFLMKWVGVIVIVLG